jgi:hypothetical protein
MGHMVVHHAPCLGLKPICGATRSVGYRHLPRQPLKQWGQIQPFIDDRLLGLPGPYLRHAISTFNTCSQGPTHRSLIDTGGGYNHGGAGFSHTTP